MFPGAEDPSADSGRDEAEDLRRIRAEILERFESWLDEMLAAPDPPQGLDGDLLARLMAEDEDPEAGDPEEVQDTERSIDTYSLWASLVALTQEVKLQGRTFGRLTESLASLPGAASETQRSVLELCDLQESMSEALESVRDGALERERDSVAEVLVDLRDRLARLEGGLQETIRDVRQRPRPAGMRRLFFPGASEGEAGIAPALQSVADGLGLVTERLKDELARFGISEIRSLGITFDPAQMRAVEVGRDPAQPDGAVTEVLRRGYRMGDRVYRLCDVKVNRSSES